MSTDPAADADPESGVSEPVDQSSERRGDPRLLVLTLGVALLVWVIDQTTKWLATVHLEGKPPVRVIGDWLMLDFLRNPGAAFSVGTSSTFVFTLIAIVVAVVILRVARRLRSAWWAVALGGLLGGAMGNLTDRLFREPGFPGGHVVDFIYLKFFAVFNCADIAITGSAILMVGLALFGLELSGKHRVVGTPGDDPAEVADRAGSAPQSSQRGTSGAANTSDSPHTP
jgi:signal peptidase II